jgi:hypothetical protein
MDSAASFLDDLAGYSEAQASAGHHRITFQRGTVAIAAYPGAVCTIKALEDIGQILRSNTNASVFDGDQCPSVVAT